MSEERRKDKGVLKGFVSEYVRIFEIRRTSIAWPAPDACCGDIA